MNREAPVLKFDYRLRNDYCKPIIDYGKNSIITPLMKMTIKQLRKTLLHQEAEVSLLAKCFPVFRPMHRDRRNQFLIQMPAEHDSFCISVITTSSLMFFL